MNEISTTLSSCFHEQCGTWDTDIDILIHIPSDSKFQVYVLALRSREITWLPGFSANDCVEYRFVQIQASWSSHDRFRGKRLVELRTFHTRLCHFTVSRI